MSAREAEERGAERCAHAAERCLQPRLQRAEGLRNVVGLHREAADHAFHRLHGFEQAVERAEQAEEDEQADEIAIGLAALFEARADAVEQRPHRRGGKAHLAATPRREHRRHRCDEARRAHVEIGRVRAAPEALDPGDLWVEPQHLAEDVENPRQEDAQDHAVHGGIAHEIFGERPLEQRRTRGHSEHENGHPNQVSARTSHGFSLTASARSR
ncbi:MAG TPA: hypothetical protein VN656_10075 [Stellaceae bacterium]|nr:hypothetical protein [Stellaceae bacterium]